MIKFVRRLAAHGWLVGSEFAYGVIKLKQPFPEAVRYLVMRTFTPFGLFRGWDKERATTSRAALVELAQSGFVALDPLPAAAVEELRDHFCRNVDAGEGRSYATLGDYFDQYRREGIQRPRGILATGKDDCPITRIASSDQFVDLAAEFLGIEKRKLVSVASMDALIRLDRPRNASTVGYDDALEFHRDIDAFRFVKMFVFLTDVTRDSGHHEVYLGSHRRTPLALGPIVRFSNADIEAAIPQAKLHHVEGPAGYAYAENTFAFHRGTKPLLGDRLILNLEYMEDGFRGRYPGSFELGRQHATLEAA